MSQAEEESVAAAAATDLESSNCRSNRHRQRVSHWRLVTDHALITPAVLRHGYRGAGTPDDPYMVEFIPDDPRNPVMLPHWKKWVINMVLAMATLAVTFASSAYTGGVREIRREFGGVSAEVATLGISLFVLGFAVGPVLWGPMSELYGRQIVFVGTYTVLTVFNAAGAGADSIEALVLTRLVAGTFGSSCMVNAGGVIADMFSAQQRGLATSIFACAPFLGPTIGPIVGGFVGENIGWRWIQGIMAIFTGTLAIVGGLMVPETYAPVLLRKRADALSKRTGNVYISILDRDKGPVSARKSFETGIVRPWVFLFREPIVLLISIHMAIVFGTLYMLFAAFPIIFEQGRGWNAGLGGLSFTGVLVGLVLGLAYSILDNNRYVGVANRSPNGSAPPEARLVPALVGSVAVPLGMFWFAWTNSPSVHWSVSIIASAPFGFGLVLIVLAQISYLIDSYTIYAASVLAASTVLRSLFGTAFPLFTPRIYAKLGIHWASSIPAFLALACVPFPFLFYRYGASIRSRCKYAAAAAEAMKQIRQTELSS